MRAASAEAPAGSCVSAKSVAPSAAVAARDAQIPNSRIENCVRRPSTWGAESELDIDLLTDPAEPVMDADDHRPNNGIRLEGTLVNIAARTLCGTPEAPRVRGGA